MENLGSPRLSAWPLQLGCAAVLAALLTPLVVAAALLA